MNTYHAQKAKESLLKIAKKFNIEKECHPVLNNQEFFIWSGSSKPQKHHYGDYGLIIHTEEVVRLCLLNADALDSSVDRKLLILSALYHDIGKIYDYEKINDNWQSTNHKKNIHHITRSAIIFNENVHSISQEEKNEVTHAILSHHGLREWGSPVSPNTQIAWLLHLCDNISARMNDCNNKSKEKKR